VTLHQGSKSVFVTLLGLLNQRKVFLRFTPTFRKVRRGAGPAIHLRRQVVPESRFFETISLAGA
jgi:hypothetical protein